MEKISNPNFSVMKKYFSSGFFSNIKSLISAFQRHQLELLGVSESETTRETSHRTQDAPESQESAQIGTELALGGELLCTNFQFPTLNLNISKFEKLSDIFHKGIPLCIFEAGILTRAHLRRVFLPIFCPPCRVFRFIL